jgi:AcrR family transcriptional regulator
MAATTKERIRDSTAELFRRHGYNGTGVKQIVAAAKAPFGSLYHHFPGGKEALGAEVIRWSGAKYGELVPMVFDPAPDPATGVEWFFAGAAETLRESGYEDACPIATVALEVASTSEPLREATHEVFEAWLAALAERFAAAGPDRARSLALAVLASLEGAFVLSRAARSTEAMAAAGAASAACVRAELG